MKTDDTRRDQPRRGEEQTQPLSELGRVLIEATARQHHAGGGGLGRHLRTVARERREGSRT